MPVDYQEGKIYKIYNTINDDIYVGSTTMKLCERMRNHRCFINSQKSKDRPLYQAFREHGIDNFYIELIEKCPCNDKDELRRTEGKYIRGLKPALNTQIAGRTQKEYREDNREYIKEYRDNNREYIKELKRQHYEHNKEHISEQRKQYYEDNKEEHFIHLNLSNCGCALALRFHDHQILKNALLAYVFSTPTVRRFRLIHKTIKL